MPLSVKNLTKNFRDKRLDVKSFTGQKSNKVDLSLDDLIDPDREERSQLQGIYKEILKSSLEDIKIAVDKRKKDAFIVIPDTSLKSFLYDQKDCMDYVEKNLKNLHMDTVKVKNDLLFVTWFNIKDNLTK